MRAVLPNRFLMSWLMPWVLWEKNFPLDRSLYLKMLMAAKAMGAGVDIIKPLMAGDAGSSLGTCVIGTVQGDLHDIGKKPGLHDD